MLKDDKFDIDKEFDESGIVLLGVSSKHLQYYIIFVITNCLYFVRLFRLSTEEEIANFIDCS